MSFYCTCVFKHVYQRKEEKKKKVSIQASQMTTPPIAEHIPVCSPSRNNNLEERERYCIPSPASFTALVAIHPLSSCTITDGGNNIASTGYHNNRPQHPVQTTLALHHHAPCAGLHEAVSAVVIYFTRYHHHHHHGHGGTFLRLFGLSIKRGRWPL